MFPDIPLSVSRFPIGLEHDNVAVLAVSPNDERLVCGSGGPLFLRQLDQLKGRELPGTEGASRPFFSADGQSIGFAAGGKLKTLALDGGLPKTLCDASSSFGGSWGSDGVIYFSPSTISGLWKISADGGNPERVTTPDKEKEEYGHWWPDVLPGGDAVLFTIWKIAVNDTCVAVLSLETGQRQTLLVGGSCALRPERTYCVRPLRNVDGRTLRPQDAHNR